MGNSLFDLTGKVALVTGGNGGIGYSMATGMAKAGADIVIWGTNPEKTAKARKSLEALGVKVHASIVDLRDEPAIVSGMAEAVETMGRIDTAIANAGVVGPIKPTAKYEADEFRDVLSVNLEGAFLTFREAVRHMVPRAKAGDGGGSLIGISSVGAIHGAGRTPAYGASKGGMLSLCRSMAVEHARFGIRANCVHPGWVSTDISVEAMKDPKYQALVHRIPTGRFGNPEDFEAIAVYLSCDASSFHTGDDIVIDGGYTVF